MILFIYLGLYLECIYLQVIGDNMKNYSSIARKDKSVFISVNFRGSKCWVPACHHHGVVPDDEDAQPLAQVSHHLVLVLPQVSGQLPPQLDDCGQAQLVPAAKRVDSKGEEGDCLGVASLLILPQLTGHTFVFVFT